MRANQLIAWLTGLLTLLLALFSFILSFQALQDLAGQHGLAIPALFPLIVEAAVIIFSLNALYRSLAGESARMQWGLIIGSSTLAGIFNIAHAEANFLSRAMAAMPSLFLLLSFETFLGQVKHAVKRSNVIQSIVQLEREFEQKQVDLERQFEQKRSSLQAEVEQINSDLNGKRSIVQELAEQIEQQRSTIVQLEAEIAELNRSKKATQIVQYDVLNDVNAEKLNDKQAALNALLNFYRSNPNASLNEAGDAIGRSKGTVSNYLNELEQAGLIHRNGSGVEVTQ